MRRFSDLNTIRSCILGHAVADALGLPVQFKRREALDAEPVTGMLGHGTYDMPPGAWSDDTSMTLCALAALGRGGDELNKVMENFGKWMLDDAFTPTDWAYDIGKTCQQAIARRFILGLDLDLCGMVGERSNGNGSLMRIIPFALYAPDDMEFIEKGSALTHAHMRSKIACVIYSRILAEIIETHDKSAVRSGLEKAKERYSADPNWRYYEPLFNIGTRTRDSISSSGYVVDTLEAALWCLLTTDSYAECVLKAVNLGRDTDTVAAVVGGLAGALYGVEAIPQEWLDALIRREFIERLCREAAQAWKK